VYFGTFFRSEHKIFFHDGEEKGSKEEHQNGTFWKDRKRKKLSPTNRYQAEQRGLD